MQHQMDDYHIQMTNEPRKPAITLRFNHWPSCLVISIRLEIWGACVCVCVCVCVHVCVCVCVFSVCVCLVCVCV